MKRRDFLTLLASAAVAWPLAARAQQSGMPVIGFLGLAGVVTSNAAPPEFLRGLAEAGYAPGRNLAIEFRLVNGRTFAVNGRTDGLRDHSPIWFAVRWLLS